MANTSSDLMMKTLTEIVQYGSNTGSVNLYMAHGGTNFGYWAGNFLADAPWHVDCLIFSPNQCFGLGAK